MKDPALALPLAAALGEGLKRAGTSLAKADGNGTLRALLSRAPEIASDAGEPAALRRVAIDTLAMLPFAEAAPALLAILTPKQPPALQGAAITALGQFRDPSVGAELLHRYPGLGPDARSRVLDVVLQRPERMGAFWTAMETNTVRAGELTASQVNSLRQHRDEKVRQRAALAFGPPASASRQAAYQAFLPALQLNGLAARGKSIFEGRCAACHQHAGMGHDFGPDLGAARTGGREKLLASMIDPNREVMPQFMAYAVETKDGEGLLGMLENETATAVTLRLPGGIRKTLPRSAIASLKSQQQSLMPEGLESGLTAQDLADLMEFIFNPRT